MALSHGGLLFKMRFRGDDLGRSNEVQALSRGAVVEGKQLLGLGSERAIGSLEAMAVGGAFRVLSLPGRSGSRFARAGRGPTGRKLRKA